MPKIIVQNALKIVFNLIFILILILVYYILNAWKCVYLIKNKQKLMLILYNAIYLKHLKKILNCGKLKYTVNELK